MYKLVALPALALLAACVGSAPDSDISIDRAGAAEAAETPPDLVAVANYFDSLQGQKPFGGDLTVLGASAEGDRLTMSFRNDNAASAFGPAAREIYEMQIAGLLRDGFCGDPATRKFVETYGGVAADIVTSDGEPLAAVEVTSCAAA